MLAPLKKTPTATLPATSRLRLRADFAHIKSSGTKLTSRFWMLQHTPSRCQHVSRLGIITTRRSGKSHERSRMRRVAREFFRTHKATLHPPQDIVLIARSGAELADNAALRAELAELWNKLNLTPAT